MQRYFVEPGDWQEECVSVRGQDAHHLMRVMRAKIGEPVIVCDGATREALAEVAAFGAEVVELRVTEWRTMEREPLVDVWVAQSLPKGDKFETVLQKGTEIGAVGFVPFVSERTVVQVDAKKEAKRMERWQKIVKEAAEQAHRSRLPAIAAVHSWRSLLDFAGEFELALLCYEKADSLSLKQALQAAEKSAGAHTRRVLVVIGPEGGFTEREVAAAEAAGVRTITLGRRILRTETAAAVALSGIFYEWDV
jgi:16S rRNA (uracil1498-N3)-methyltransferase